MVTFGKNFTQTYGFPYLSKLSWKDNNSKILSKPFSKKISSINCAFSGRQHIILHIIATMSLASLIPCASKIKIFAHPLEYK